MYNTQLETFITVADLGSFNKAAEALYISAPAVTKQINLLERAKKAMQEKDQVLRIATSPMTPAQPIVTAWSQAQEKIPGLKLQLIPFMNSQENAREILKNLGTNIDVVAGIFDDTMLRLRQCSGLELSRQPICCAVAAGHRLAGKERLTIQDLYGENLLMMHRGWSNYVDELRDDIWKNHPQINVVDFDIYTVDIFNGWQAKKRRTCA
ncbi:MAG: LysR family transcriptional regulator [Clostridium sp.]|nr:LysR family transcriptional regulator [Clostridium sp.]